MIPSMTGSEVDVFRAIADPTRRAMLDMLAERELDVTDVGTCFDMSQPAISQHLKVLRDAGLVVATRHGKRRIYRVQPQPLRAVHAWVAQFEKFWIERLDALGALLDRQDADNPTGEETWTPPPAPPPTPPRRGASSTLRSGSSGSTPTRARRSGRR
jgi:DNA-binding transcriptional ArsR family regulator